jgi:CBS domain-containing membrane protein
VKEVTMDRNTRTEIDRILGTVGEIMERHVVALRPDQLLGEAARDLERAGVSGAPVMTGGRIVGIVSLRDLFQAAGLGATTVATSGPWHRYEHAIDQSGQTVDTAIETNVATVTQITPISEAAALMRERHVNRIPVLDDDGRLVGIVARDEIVEAVAEAARVLHERGTGIYQRVPQIPPD